MWIVYTTELAEILLNYMEIYIIIVTYVLIFMSFLEAQRKKII